MALSENSFRIINFLGRKKIRDLFVGPDKKACLTSLDVAEQMKYTWMSEHPGQLTHVEYYIETHELGQLTARILRAMGIQVQIQKTDPQNDLYEQYMIIDNL